jgi:hypothetical protein
MPIKKLSRNAPCPCGSGKRYKHCCLNKGFDWLVDEKGDKLKSIPMPKELGEALEQQKQRFVEKYGREPAPDDNLFFDMPPLEHAEHFIVEAMKKAGMDPTIIYAFEKTGLIVTEANEHLISDKDRAEWEAAVREHRTKQWEESGEKDNEWF